MEKEIAATITVILTCYNRSAMTLSCIRSLTDNKAELLFIVVDDNSTDGTPDRLRELMDEGVKVKVLFGDGGLYYSGGMRKGIAAAKEQAKTPFYLIVNDDVVFKPGILDKLIGEEGRFFAEKKEHEVLIGCTCAGSGSLTYGGIRYTGSGIRYMVCPPEDDGLCDTFNANCVLIPRDIFFATENIDPVYIHSLGDFDYGMSMSRRGISLRTFGEYVGECNENGTDNTWMDKSLGIRQRLRKKESPKGAPFHQWFYYLKKNFGIKAALLHGWTPYIRILLGK